MLPYLFQHQTTDLAQLCICSSWELQQQPDNKTKLIKKRNEKCIYSIGDYVFYIHYLQDASEK